MFFGALASFFVFSSEAAVAVLPFNSGSRAARESWGAAGAVVYTNVIIGLYVWSAFNEPDEAPASDASEDAPARPPRRRKGE
jgi:hypothetical protein